jgi:hypothetical protein
VLVEQAKFNLGDLFNAEDYPSIDELKNKFGFRLVFSPLPESNDFRLDIPQQDLADMARDYDVAYNDRLADAMREPWDKLHKCLGHISEKLTADIGADGQEIPKRYHDTLITNARELCGLLTHLNITKDPKLEDARKQLELTMLGLDIEDIKDNANVRVDVKAKVDEILGKFDW